MNEQSPPNQRTAGERLQEAAEWIYGPVYQSLPVPLKKVSSWTDNAEERKEAMGKYLDILGLQDHDLLPDRVNEYHLRTVAYHYGLGIHQGLPESNNAYEVMLEVPGLGRRGLYDIHEAFIQGVGEGLTPGQVVLSRADDLYKQMAEDVKKWNKMLLGWNQKQLIRPVPRATLQALRVWWVENGGSE